MFSTFQGRDTGFKAISCWVSRSWIFESLKTDAKTDLFRIDDQRYCDMNLEWMIQLFRKLTRCTPGASCLKVVAIEIGGTTALEFHCSGSWPAWIARVPKWGKESPIFWAVESFAILQAEKERALAQTWRNNTFALLNAECIANRGIQLLWNSNT